jgi:anti-sigma factor RsiW
LNCQETQKLLHAYVDGELDLVKNLEIEEHLQQCSACAQAHQSLEALRAAIRSQCSRYQPSTQLQARIRLAVRVAGRDGSRRRTVRLGWLAVAASFLFLAIVAWSLIGLIAGRTAPPVLTEELLASHIRSQMLPAHLVDVESSDRHTVKPWFEGKLDFSPQVPDLADEGFKLLGGRLDYLSHRPVAALVYQRRKHLINLFIWASAQPSNSTVSLSTRQGFHLLFWSDSGMTYWAVSDLNESELRHFVELVRQQ